jgi:hypothetical protein
MAFKTGSTRFREPKTVVPRAGTLLVFELR